MAGEAHRYNGSIVAPNTPRSVARQVCFLSALSIASASRQAKVANCARSGPLNVCARRQVCHNMDARIQRLGTQSRHLDRLLDVEPVSTRRGGQFEPTVYAQLVLGVAIYTDGCCSPQNHEVNQTTFGWVYVHDRHRA